MKKILFSMALLFVSLLSFSQIIVQGEITSNTTWTNDNIYLLDGWVYVRAGATLTIEPGTIVKGDFATKGSLIIERDAKIIADGTAAQPIVFTSQKPAGQRSYGDWGGLIICGRASVNTPANGGNGTEAGEAIIEGGVGSIYGGGATPNDADSSGVLRYVRLEFGGIPFQPNSEINGLTMGGVGNKTVIENVQVSYSGDDAFEWFGGTVNARNLVSYRNWDDDFDTDFGFRGNIQFGLVVRDPDIADQSGSNGFESDNDGTGTANIPITRAIFSNITVVGPLAFSSTINSNYKRSLHIRRNSQTSVFNSIFTSYPTGLLIDGSTTHTNATNNDLRFKNSVICHMNDSLATTTSADPNNITGAFNITSWFNMMSFSNSLVNQPADIMFNSISLDNPDFTLQNNSAYMTGADFSDSYLSNWFNDVNYRGAFNGDNWTSCWTEWDPQNEPYNSSIDNTVTVEIEANNSVQFCAGGSVMLSTISNDPNATFLWSNGATSGTLNVATSGVYSVLAESSEHCTANSNEIEVTVFENPVVNIEADGNTSLCTGSSVTLSSDQASGNIWSSGQETQSIVVTSSGTYFVTFQDENGCEAESNQITVNVSDSPAPTISTNGSTTICDGDVLELTSSEGETYSWSFNGNTIDGADQQMYDATEEGLYTVTVTNTDACNGTGESTATVIFVNPTPVAMASGDLDITQLAVQFVNESTGASSYLWDFGDGNQSTETNPLHTYGEGGNYEITLTAINGDCEDVYTFNLSGVKVDEMVETDHFVLFPNPANDIVNIVFERIQGNQITISVYEIGGKEVMKENVQISGGEGVVQINSSYLPNGFYTISFLSESVNSGVQKLIVRH